MNEKITLQDLVNLFSEKQGINKKDADFFIRSMFDLIEEALTNEKYVKVKGLGTFKLTEVDSRESVNVNTGERIEIQGHTKISFTPDTSMKDLINKPFSHFETVILNEGVELEDTPIEIPGLPVQEEIVAEPLVQEEATPVEKVVEEKVEITPIETTPVVKTAPVETPTEKEPVSIEEKKEKQTHRILWVIIAILVLIILFGCYWIFMQPQKTTGKTPIPPVQEKIDVSQPIQEVVSEDTLAQEQVSATTTIETPVDETPVPLPKNDRVASLADTLDYQIVGTKTTYTLKNGESIIKASVKFYGAKMFWPYIVKHNIDVLKDPDNISAGTEIKIPELTPKN